MRVRAVEALIRYSQHLPQYLEVRLEEQRQETENNSVVGFARQSLVSKQTALYDVHTVPVPA